ncbi:MAG: hypothetical protein QOF16_481 [Actinomycetota bacterium]|nr:hypothetical protein [Actinomycetota bacterium]MEA2486827.1 hypothetical protein [Actinomycetota bacterium]
MKIEAHCSTCDRRFLLEQIGPDSDAPGRCPFCGARFGRHYTTVLIETVEDAERASTYFINALRKLQTMETGFEVDMETLLEHVAEQISDEKLNSSLGRSAPAARTA